MRYSGRVITLSLLAVAWSGHALAQSKNTIRFEEEIITGKVPKPEVMMIITRQNLNSSYSLELDESFLPRIVQSVEHSPL